MDRRRRLKTALRRIAYRVKWWRRLGIAALAAGVFIYVPAVPFSPSCGLADHRIRIKAPMSPEYRAVLKEYFDGYEIGYWDIGGPILITAWAWITGTGNVDGDDLRHAYSKAASYLGNDKYAVSRDGKTREVFPRAEGQVIAGKVYRVPDHVKALRDPWTGQTNYDNCEYMYGVVTGQPVPTELFAQWPWWAKRVETRLKPEPPSAGW
jgi:hypothetical protein